MKITSVKGTNDYLPNEVEIRDYLQNEILKVYVANGFEHILLIFHSEDNQIGRAHV